MTSKFFDPKFSKNITFKMSYLAEEPINHNSCKMLQLSLVPKKTWTLNLLNKTYQVLSKFNVQAGRPSTDDTPLHCGVFCVCTQQACTCATLHWEVFCVCMQKACARATLHLECFCVCTQKAWVHGVGRTWLLVGVVLHATPLRLCKIRWQALWRLDL